MEYPAGIQNARLQARKAGVLLIDREGIVRWKHIGPVLDDDPTLLTHLRETLREES